MRVKVVPGAAATAKGGGLHNFVMARGGGHEFDENECYILDAQMETPKFRHSVLQWAFCKGPAEIEKYFSREDLRNYEGGKHPTEPYYFLAVPSLIQEEEEVKLLPFEFDSNNNLIGTTGGYDKNTGEPIRDDRTIAQIVPPHTGMYSGRLSRRKKSKKKKKSVKQRLMTKLRTIRRQLTKLKKQERKKKRKTGKKKKKKKTEKKKNK